MSISKFSNIPTPVSTLFKERFGSRVKFDEPLHPYVAYRVGGPADLLVFPSSEEDLAWISAIVKIHQIPLTVIGTGTNLLVKDLGIRGITISLLNAFQEIDLCESQDGCALVRVGAGVQKNELLLWAIQNALKGLEFSAGVPGTIGGGIYMNAGTKYGCYGNIIQELRIFDFVNGGKQLRREEMKFGYRHQSVVKDSIVIWVSFRLYHDDQSRIEAEVNRIIKEREQKQPLDFPSCGSTFKNPEGYSAGRLIEKAGLKGLRIGGAEVSEKHANFILNRGDAKASDILQLISIIKNRVKSLFGVELDCEVVILGAE